ncbi:MAG: RNA polymerase sigma factor [Elusimicrobiota bacterium]|nr:RNA polymerase sigma factor [Elusimicrobiota bacterium]
MPEDSGLKTLLARRAEFLAFLQSRVGGQAEAEEVLQAAYLKGLKSLDQVTDESGVVPWFYRVLRSAMIDHLRRDASRRRMEEKLAAEGEPLEAPDPELEKAVCQCVKAVVPDLKPEYGEILTKVEVEEKSVAEAAKDLGLSANNASVRLHRARQSLRKGLLDACGACAEHGCRDCTCRHG